MNYAVIGLGFGDEGKGTMVDWLCQTEPIEMVVRHNGGPQALHNVVLPDGRAHGFSQFGSGTLCGDKQTLMSSTTIVDPLSMEQEAFHLLELGIQNPMKYMHIAEEALLLTPLHRMVCRWREDERGPERHGSTGLGIGEAVRFAQEQPENALHVGDIYNGTFEDKVVALRKWVKEQGCDAISEYFAPRPFRDRLTTILTEATIFDAQQEAAVLSGDNIVFEGAQGVLLDEWYGFHPYTTWSTTTFANVNKLMAHSTKPLKRMGVIRSYYTRHGPGPFPSEIGNGLQQRPEEHNYTEKYMGAFRVGNFDSVLFDYALRVAGDVDILAVTHADRMMSSRVYGYAWGDGSQARHIPIKMDETELEAQERLTEQLFQAHPLLEPMHDIEEGLPTWGYDHLVKSFGPTYKDKTEKA